MSGLALWMAAEVELCQDSAVICWMWKPQRVGLMRSGSQTQGHGLFSISVTPVNTAHRGTIYSGASENSTMLSGHMSASDPSPSQ
jgi:hypothetical protein